MFRVAFLGRGRLGLEVLEGLLANPNIEVPLIASCGATPEVADNADRMQALAAEHGADYFATNNINRAEWRARLAAADLDLAVAMLWLHTIDAATIATARHGFINCHGGHLPEYRGNACANWAILNGEPFIGTSAHLMAPGALDNGPVIFQDRVGIGPDSTIGELIEELETKGRDLVLRAVEAFRTGTAPLVPQDEARASYCYPRIPRDGEIDWREPAAAIDRLVRAAGRPYPGAYSWFHDRATGAPRRLTIWAAHVERHPLDRFFAVPGHMLKIGDGARRAIVCGDNRLLVLDEIAIDGAPADPAAAFRTVRQRMGLDHAQLAADAHRRLTALESLGGLAARFCTEGGDELERRAAEIDAVVEQAVAALTQAGVAAVANPARNYSFQKRWFDWERRERWFGVQLYRSLRLSHSPEEPAAIGFWHFSNAGGVIERRLYAALKPEYAAQWGAALGAAFAEASLIPTATALDDQGMVQGVFTVVEEPAERCAEALTRLGIVLAERMRG